MKSIGLLGRKIGMTTIFDESGNAIPVTVLSMGPCYVSQKKTVAKDGYDAIQLGFEKTKSRYERRKVGGKIVRKLVAPNRPIAGHFKKANIDPLKHMVEFRGMEVEKYQIGQELKVADVFEADTRVDVTGVSKGRGFAGGVKRWHYKGGHTTHGSMHHRAPGSIGASSDPSNVHKNKHMPGHMGNVNRTVQNLKVVKVDVDKNLLLVRGAVPGVNGGLIVCKRAILA